MYISLDCYTLPRYMVISYIQIYWFSYNLPYPYIYIFIKPISLGRKPTHHDPAFPPLPSTSRPNPWDFRGIPGTVAVSGMNSGQ